MPEPNAASIVDAISEGSLEPLAAPAPPAPEPPKPEPRKRYGSFYEAWACVADLRKYTQRTGMPRFGLNAEGQARAQELIDEYRHG